MNLIVRVNTAEIRKSVNRTLRAKVPNATKNALNRTGYDVIKVLKGSMPKHLDRPTRFTLNAFGLRRAKLGNLTAYVYVKRLQEAYLIWQVFGGTAHKPKVVPARTWPKNAYGNLSRGATKAANVYKSNLRGRPAYWKLRGPKNDKRFDLIGFIPATRRYTRRFPMFRIGEGAAMVIMVKKMRSEIRRLNRF